MDDCSTDNTQKVLDNIAQLRDKEGNPYRIRIFHNEKNSGAAVSRLLAGPSNRANRGDDGGGGVRYTGDV